MSKLERLNNDLESIACGSWVPENIGYNLRGCGCAVATLTFTKLDPSVFRENKNEVFSALQKIIPDWNLYYITSIPGSESISKISLRKLCAHCKENYIMEKTIGTHSTVLKEKLESRAGNER